MESNSAIADRKPCFSARCCAELKRLVLLAVVSGLLLIAGKYYCFDRLNEAVRSRVETVLRNHYQGLNVSVQSARRIAGRGVEIRGVRIAEAGGRLAPILAEIDEIFAECDTRLPDFLTGHPKVAALRVHRLKLRAERKASGLWNIAHLLPLPPCQGSLAPTATIRDASLEIIDSAQPARSGPSGLMLRNIELSVAPQTASGVREHPGYSAGSSTQTDREANASRSPSPRLRVRGTLAGDHFERVEIDGTLDPHTSQWDLKGAVEGLEFSPRLRAGLPSELAAALAPVSSIRGRTFFGFHVSRGPRASNQPEDASPIQFTVHGKISEGRVDDARLPEPLTDVEATIRLDNHGLSIDGLSARCGPTEIELTAPLIGFAGTESAEVELTARSVPLERVPAGVISPAARETWQHFHPKGFADVVGRMMFDGRQWQPDLDITCRDLSLFYDGFPYRLTDGTGTIEARPDHLAVNVRLAAGEAQLLCQADIRNPGPNFTGWVQLQSEGAIAVDEKLLQAMDDGTQRLVRAFRPRGNATFVARLFRNPGDSTTHRHLEINLQQCTIQHDRFAYPIDRVGGMLVNDDSNWRFVGLKGRNDSAEIRGEGSWAARGAGSQQLLLSFVARDVPLADELRDALPPTAQRLWANVSPRGNLDEVTTDLRYTATSRQWSIDIGAKKWQTQASRDNRTISLEPGWFRYSLHDVTGEFRYRDGRIELSNLRAAHGQAAVSAEGNCELSPGGGCRLRLNSLAADHVDADQELLAALPNELGQMLTRFPLQGPVNLLGKLTLTLPPQPQAQPQVTWDLDLDVENGRLLTPTPVEHVHGGLSINGRRGPEGLFCRGELNVDSAIVHGLQLTNLQGPYWCDGQQLVLGAIADRDTRNGVPRQMTARTLGGLLSVDGVAQLASSPSFDVQATLANADLAEIARLLAPHQLAPVGRIFGLIHIGGDSLVRHSWRGEGKISLREADVYELPAMIQLLKLLSIQRPDRTAFTNSNIDFRVEGEDVSFDRIDFSGDAISLKGKGRMNGQREIDLKFYPLVGRAERVLPVFRPLVGQTAREFMLIEVTGTLDQPQITRQVFPNLDQRLALLFPELVPNERPVAVEPTPAIPGTALNRLWPFPRR